jgi:hypothetical protein
MPSAERRQGSTTEGARRRRWLDPRGPGRRKPATPLRSDFDSEALSARLESLSSMTRTDARRLKHCVRVPSSSGDAPSRARPARVDALGLDPYAVVAALRSTRARASTAKRLTAPQSRLVPGGKRRPARLSHPRQQVHRRGMRQAQPFPAIPVNGRPPGTCQRRKKRGAHSRIRRSGSDGSCRVLSIRR